MNIFFALLAALANAVSTITQHLASTTDTTGITGWRFVRYLATNPLWLFGWVALLGAFVEHFTQDVGDLATASVAFLALCIGVVMMTVTVPETIQRAEPTTLQAR